MELLQFLLFMTGLTILFFYILSFIMNLIILNTFDLIQKVMQYIFVSIILRNYISEFLKLWQILPTLQSWEIIIVARRK